jgi:phospholipid/cholesterol/gamma-HCH transport system substrate-binding protein
VKEGRELLVGTTIVVGIIVAVVGTLWLTGTNWGQAVTRVDVLVRDVGQLIPGNEVKFRGVPIGRVATIAVDSGGEAVRVGLELDGQVLLPDDAQALISPASLFGDWQAEIVTRSRFPRFDYYEVTASVGSDSIRVLGGYALPDISRLTAAADEISENLAVLTDRIDRAFNEETADALAQAIRNVQTVSDDIKNLIQQQAATFENVSVQVERAATEIGQSATVARVTLERLDRVLANGEVDSILVNVRSTTSSLSELSSSLGETNVEFKAILSRADTALSTLGRVASQIENGEGSLGRLLVDDALALRAEAAMGQLESLLQDLRENPGRYVRLSIF